MIPESPKIKLRNYLLDLLTKNDSKERSLYLVGVSPFIKEIWQEIIKSNSKLNVRELIPTKFGITTGTLYNRYMNCKRSVPIQFIYKLLLLWKDVCNKNKKQLKHKWDELFNLEYKFVTHSKCQKAKLPKYLTPKLSYLIGWLCGDGNFTEVHNYVVKISEKSTKQLGILKSLVKELFGVEVPIFKRSMNGHAIQFGSKATYRFFKNFLKIKVGQVPNFVKKLDLVNKRYFLMGIFDSEGCVLKGRHRITISQSNRSFLLQIAELFADLDVYFQKPTFHKTRLGEWYSIGLGSKGDFVKFAQRVGSNHIDKSPLIERWVDKIESGNSKFTFT